MIQHTNNGKKWLLIEVPEGATFCNRTGNDIICDHPKGFFHYALPQGQFGTPRLASQMYAIEIVQLIVLYDYFVLGSKMYKDYINLKWTSSVYNSFESLLSSYNLKPDTTLIIEQIK